MHQGQGRADAETGQLGSEVQGGSPGPGQGTEKGRERQATNLPRISAVTC